MAKISSYGLEGEVGNLISHNMYAYGVSNPVISVEAKALLISIRLGSLFEISDLQIETGLSGEVGSIGDRFGIYYKNGEFYLGGGYAVGVGYDVYIRIKFE